jgi:CxxC motif-containing protein
MDKKIICIQCPIGCTVNVEYDGDSIISITGNRCKKGEAYAKKEFVCSYRVLTSTVFCKTTKGILPLPVKTDGEIPLEMLREAVKEIRKTVYTAPINAGDVVYENILNTGVNVIATKSMPYDFKVRNL